VPQRRIADRSHRISPLPPLATRPRATCLRLSLTRMRRPVHFAFYRSRDEMNFAIAIFDCSQIKKHSADHCPAPTKLGAVHPVAKKQVYRMRPYSPVSIMSPPWPGRCFDYRAIKRLCLHINLICRNYHRRARVEISLRDFYRRTNSLLQSGGRM